MILVQGRKVNIFRFKNIFQTGLIRKYRKGKRFANLKKKAFSKNRFRVNIAGQIGYFA
jgi:hypothetical protein